MEGKLTTRIEACMASNQAVGLASQYDEEARKLSLSIQRVHKLRVEGDEWNGEEDKLQRGGESGRDFSDLAEQSTQLVPSADNSMLQDGVVGR